MALQKLSTVKNWFEISLKSTQNQFLDTWDSFRNKDEKVAVAMVEGMDEVSGQLSPKAIYKSGQLFLFKHPDNGLDTTTLEPNDTVIGYVGGVFLNARTYYGGDPMLLTSYIQPEILPPAFAFYYKNTQPSLIMANNEVLVSSYVYRDLAQKIIFESHLGTVEDAQRVILLDPNTEEELVVLTYDPSLFKNFPDLNDFTIDLIKQENDVFLNIDIDKDVFMNYNGTQTTFSFYTDFRKSDYCLVLYVQITDNTTREIYNLPLFTAVLFPENIL